MKITITQYNKTAYIKTLTEGLKRFINYCNDYPDNKEYNHYKNIAVNLLNDYNSIALNILQFCFGTEYINNIIYPAKMLHYLYSFRDYAYNNNSELLTITEQQNKAKNYIHFDFSVKRPKTLKDI